MANLYTDAKLLFYYCYSSITTVYLLYRQIHGLCAHTEKLRGGERKGKVGKNKAS